MVFGLLLRRCRFGLLTPDSYKLAHNEIFFKETLFPASQIFQLFSVKALELIQRSVQILCQHLFVEALACKSAAGITPGEVGIRPTGTVEIPPGGHVKDSTTDREVDGHAVKAIVREKLGRGKGPEDGRRRRSREGLRLGGFESPIHQNGKEGDED